MCFKEEHVRMSEGEEFKECIVVLLLRKDIHFEEDSNILHFSYKTRSEMALYWFFQKLLSSLLIQPQINLSSN